MKISSSEFYKGREIVRNFDAIIIGGGASGCMTAMCTNNKSIAIIDAGKSLAKKIMVTGNGRCNLTNMNMDSQYFNQDIEKFLAKFDQEQTLTFFHKLGLETYSDEEGRVYPRTNSAKSVVDVINAKLDGNVETFLDQKVINIKTVKDGFQVTTDKETFTCKKLVIASGSNTLVEILKNLGIELTPFVPSLTAIKCSDVKDLNGVKVSNVKVTITSEKGASRSEMGEVLFKDSGLSGIVIFNLSTIFARENSFVGKVFIDLLPDISEKELCKKILTRKSLNVALNKLFVGMFVNGIANEIFRQSKLNTNISLNKLTENQAMTLSKTIKKLTFNVCGCYDNNQVFSGGVQLSSLNEKLMSKSIPNLYFTGEICDVDGVCGGYNLQWAWTSGKIVGDNL